MKKKNITRILQALLIFAVFTFIGMLVFDFHSSKVAENSLAEVVDVLDQKIEENKKIVAETSNQNQQQPPTENQEPTAVTQPVDMGVKIGNSTVFGKIKIDKIGIEYPIIEYVNDNSLWKSICKISHNSINGTGNLCIAGHNMRNQTMFGKLRRVEIGDKVEITNVYGDKYVYTIYDMFYVDPSQVDVLRNTEDPILTMITCNNTLDKRLIVRAKLD